MVSNQVVTGVNIWSLAVIMLGPAAITGVVSIIISRFQLKMKGSELKGESEYKARENLFKLYQEKLKGAEQSNKLLNKVFGQMLGSLAGGDKQEEIKLIKRQLKFMNYFNEQVSDSIDEIEEELKKCKLLTEKMEEQISFVRKTIATDLRTVSDEEVEQVAMNYLKVSNLLYSLEHTLLDNKRDELFSKYLT